MPKGTRRRKTSTHAECFKCTRMVPHQGFNKGQSVCRECQRARKRDRYSKGRLCTPCGTPISDYAPRDTCRACSIDTRRAQVGLRKGVAGAGYVVLRGYEGHPNADSRGRIYEHVLVMSEKLGRALVAGENVHHLNGVRHDNRPENLELWSRSQPPGQRVSDKVAWAKELLALYEPSALA